MEALHFLRPAWFLALVPGLLLGLWLLRYRHRGGRWAEVVEPELLSHLLLEGARRGRPWGIALWFLALLLAVTALAGPAFKRLPQPVFRDESALVVMLDLSRSMDAADLRPSRLERARYKLEDLLEARRTGLTALIVYAGDAFVVTPLTDDVRTIRSLLAALSTDLMPVPGSRPERAVAEAVKLLRQAGLPRGDLLLVTDGIDQTALERIPEETGGCCTLSVLGVGTPAGAPIPLPRGGFIRDTEGRVVSAALEEERLKELARRMDGLYRRMEPGERDLHALLRWSTAAAVTGRERRDLRADLWREEGPWLLLGLLPLAALAFRRGVLAALLLALLLPGPPAQALDFDGLWRRADQQAWKRFRQQDYAGAAGLFTDPAWKAAALYRKGDYEAALEALKGLDSAEDWYNRGNALARLGRYPEALKAYDETLRRAPGHEDARRNRALVEKALQQQRQPSSGQGQGGGKEGDSGESTGQADESGRQGKAEGPSSPSPSPQPGESKAAADKEGEQQGDVPSRRESEQQPAREQEQPGTGGELAMQQPPPVAGPSGQRRKPEQESEMPEELRLWLQRVPDDPGGLLRRKFRYQYRKRGRPVPPEGTPW